jgi:uncharacterized membrane protein (TIGR02234 family)
MARTRWPVVLAALAGAALVLLASGRVWVEGTVQGLSGPVDVVATGRESQPVLPALALLAGAAAAVLAIGGRMVRRFAAVALGLAGVAVVLVTTGRAVSAARLAGTLDPAAARVSGVRGVTAQAVAVSGWPWAAVAGGAVVAAAGLLALVAGRAWPDGGTRYDRTGPVAGPGPGPSGPDQDEPPVDDPAAVWDALSRGEDPTAGRSGR